MYMNHSILITFPILSTVICCHTSEPFPNDLYEKTIKCDFSNITEYLPLKVDAAKGMGYD